MIPSFNDYHLLNESKTLKDFNKVSKYSYGESKKKFIENGYEFLGNIRLKERSNSFQCIQMMDSVPDTLIGMLKRYGKESGYLSSIPDKNYVQVSLEKGLGTEGNIEHLRTVLAEPNIDKIISCLTKSNDMYYVVWNEEKKYFFYVKIDTYGRNTNNPMVGFAELWMKIRTSGIDEIKREVQDIYDEYMDKENTRKEENMKKKAEQDEKDRLKKEKDAEYQRRVDAVEKDAREHPENYEEVLLGDLPEDVKRDINSDDKENVRYVEYIYHTGERDPYDMEKVFCFVNDDSLSHGWRFESTVNHAKPGTYWGD